MLVQKHWISWENPVIFTKIKGFPLKIQRKIEILAQKHWISLENPIIVIKIIGFPSKIK